MRSLHVITSTARRGAETFAVQLAEQLEERPDHQADVVALTASPGAALDVPVLGSHRRSSRMLLALRRAARASDVVVAHGSSTLEACAVALAGTEQPFVFRSIGDPRYWLRSSARRHVATRLMRRATRHVVLWDRAGQDLVELHGIDPRAIDVIPNGVDGRRFPAATREDRVRARQVLEVPLGVQAVAVVGALSPEKNPEAVFASARRLPEVTFLVAGDGPDLARFQRTARTLPNIRLLGSLADPYPVYAAADLLLLPSLSEGMPGVVIEAGMVGTPSLAAPVGALPSMLGTDGRLADTTEPSDIARACVQALTDLPPTSPEVWSRYGMEVVGAQWADVLDRTMQPT